MLRASAAADGQAVGRPPGGTQSRSQDATDGDALEHRRVLAWLAQACRDDKCIRLASCAGVVSVNAIWSCPMHSHVLVCWRGSNQSYRVRRRIRAPGRAKCSQATQLLHACSSLYRSCRPTGACSGRASRREIVAILETEFVPTVLSLLRARR